jgi:hypothetical protein
MDVETPLHPEARRRYAFSIAAGGPPRFSVPGGCGSVNAVAFGGGGGAGSSGSGGAGGSSSPPGGSGGGGGGGGEYAAESVFVVGVQSGRTYGFATGGYVRAPVCDCATCVSHRKANGWRIP